MFRLLVERIAREVEGRPIREHAHRNHVARLDAKPTCRAAVEEDLARVAGVREPSTQELRPAERHAVTAVHVHGEEDRVRPRDLDGTVITVARAVSELRGLRRGRDLRERADLRDRLLEIGVAIVGGVVAGAGSGRPESGTRRGGASAPSLCAARLQLPRSRGRRRARRTARPRATHATASGARSGRASRRRSRQRNRRGRGVWRHRSTDHAAVLHPHLPLRCIGHLLVVRDEQDRLATQRVAAGRARAPRDHRPSRARRSARRRGEASARSRAPARWRAAGAGRPTGRRAARPPSRRGRAGRADRVRAPRPLGATCLRRRRGA